MSGHLTAGIYFHANLSWVIKHLSCLLVPHRINCQYY